MILAIIPARFGSKGIPRKNVIDFCGKPMIQYTIEAALNSKYVDDILITTDDNEVLSIAELLGVNNSYRRPAELATDNTPMFDVVEHGVNWFKREKGTIPDTLLLLQPTSPLRTSADIDAAIELLLQENGKSLVSVHKLSEHPYECVKIENNKWSFLVQPLQKVSRRQDFQQEFFFINGAIYLTNVEMFLKQKIFFIEGESLLYEMPKERGIDIDTFVDLTIAKSLLTLGNLDSQ